MLPDVQFELVYTTGKDEPALFFLDALPESSNLDLGLGFFSSTAINALATGFALFLCNGGMVRIIINDYLSAEDKEAILKGQIKGSDQIIEDGILYNINELFQTLSNRDKHFFDCLSYLIAEQRLEVKAIIPLNSSYGISHQKFGIFSDKMNNRIAFSGSLNFSQSALLQNIESISCYSSWSKDENDLKRIEHYINAFRDLWSNNSSYAKVIPIEKVCRYISDRFPAKGLDELLIAEKENISTIRSRAGSDRFNRRILELTNKIESKMKVKPHFPDGFKPYSYQVEALENWVNDSYIGLFEMATGTGKTITSLNCALRLYEEYGKVQILILVPTIPLVNQWKSEVEDFFFENIIIANSKSPNWTTEALRAFNKSLIINTSFCIITTYDTFVLSKFKSILSRLPEDTLLIADEAHNLGAPTLLKNLPEKFTKRIGLSATPERHYDKEGTQQILNFFNSSDKPTFRLTMKDAIDLNFLCKYYYYPKTVELSPAEMQEYIKISKTILKYFDSKICAFKDNDKVERLLLKRKRIINKAEKKLRVFRDCLNDLNKRNSKINYTLVYVPEGKQNTYDDEDSRLINEYAEIITDEYDLKQHQFIGSTKDRDKILESFGKGHIDVLTAMKCLDEGVDVKRTENAIFCASTSNPRQFIQRRGRILRKHPDKKFASIYDIIVVPNLNYRDSGEHLEMERRIILNELKRVYEFASIAENKLQALKTLEDVAQEYNIDIFSSEII